MTGRSWFGCGAGGQLGAGGRGGLCLSHAVQWRRGDTRPAQLQVPFTTARGSPRAEGPGGRHRRLTQARTAGVRGHCAYRAKPGRTAMPLELPSRRLRWTHVAVSEQTSRHEPGAHRGLGPCTSEPPPSKDSPEHHPLPRATRGSWWGLGVLCPHLARGLLSVAFPHLHPPLPRTYTESHETVRRWPRVAVRGTHMDTAGHPWPRRSRPALPAAHSERMTMAKPSIKDLFKLNNEHKPSFKIHFTVNKSVHLAPCHA